MRTYSITDAARLLGVSPATVSRRLPAARASRGRSARLSLQEVNEIADVIHVDPDTVRQRAGLAETFGPDMAGAMRWAAVAAERSLNAALKAHRARIPADLLHRPTEPAEQEGLPEPWGRPDAWLPIKAPEALDALLPPLER